MTTPHPDDHIEGHDVSGLNDREVALETLRTVMRIESKVDEITAAVTNALGTLQNNPMLRAMMGTKG